MCGDGSLADCFNVWNLARDAPRVTSTSHFAWSFDRRFAYFHESLLTDQSPAKAIGDADGADEYPDRRHPHLGVVASSKGPLPGVRQLSFGVLLRKKVGKLMSASCGTGAVIENLSAHETLSEHAVIASKRSTIWTVKIEDAASSLQAALLPGLAGVDAIALSHLDVDNRGGNGFVLYANYKEADVAEETHGVNVYGEQPKDVAEHYSGMTVEALNAGTVIRISHQNGGTRVKRFRRSYDAGRTSRGHTLLPINIQLDSTGGRFCSVFSRASNRGSCLPTSRGLIRSALVTPETSTSCLPY